MVVRKCVERKVKLSVSDEKKYEKSNKFSILHRLRLSRILHENLASSSMDAYLAVYRPRRGHAVITRLLPV